MSDFERRDIPATEPPGSLEENTLPYERGVPEPFRRGEHVVFDGKFWVFYKTELDLDDGKIYASLWRPRNMEGIEADLGPRRNSKLQFNESRNPIRLRVPIEQVSSVN